MVVVTFSWLAAPPAERLTLVHRARCGSTGFFDSVSPDTGSDLRRTSAAANEITFTILLQRTLPAEE